MLARLNTEQRDKLIKLRADQSSSRMEAKRRRRNPPNDGADQEQPDGGGGQQGTPDEDGPTGRPVPYVRTFTPPPKEEYPA